MNHTLIDKTHFRVYGSPKNKTVRALLRPKVNNILPGLGWVMTNGIRAGLHVLLCDGGANLDEDTGSQWGVYVTP